MKNTDDDKVADTTILTAAELEQMRRQERQLGLVRDGMTDEDVGNTVENTLRNMIKHTRRGGEPTPYELMAIAQIRRGGAK